MLNGKAFLPSAIDQLKGVKEIKVSSRNMPEIRLISLAVNTQVFIEELTVFKQKCEEEDNQDDAPPCKSFDEWITPVFVCPYQITAQLLKGGHISVGPGPEMYKEPGKAPVYDITDDMAQASYAIASGVAEGTRLAKRYKQSRSGKPLTRGFEKFNSFLKAVGPILESFGGITSILTNFLTPNPFDALASYLEQQFELVQQRLDDIQGDIKNVEMIVEGQSNKLAMSTALRSIRHELRSYNRMMGALSKSKICSRKELLENAEVQNFIAETLYKDLRNNLEDLLDAEFGGVIEASTGLLKPYMRAYCTKDPDRAKRFLKNLQMYVYGGTAALFAYENLQCLRTGEKSCPYQQKDKDRLLEKLFKFTKKANIFETYFTDSAQAMTMYLSEGVKKIIEEEVAKVSNPSRTASEPFPGLLDKVYAFIHGKLMDTNDWLYTCIYRPRYESKKLTVFEVAETNALTFGTSFVPWAMFDVATVRTKHQVIKHSGYSKNKIETSWNMDVLRELVKRNGEYNVERRKSENRYIIMPWALNGLPPSDKSDDSVLYFMYSPMNYKEHTGVEKLIGNMVPIDVYFGRFQDTPAFTMGCWYTRRSRGWPRDYDCRRPDPNDPDRKRSSAERYVVLIE